MAYIYPTIQGDILNVNKYNMYSSMLKCYEIREKPKNNSTGSVMPTMGLRTPGMGH